MFRVSSLAIVSTKEEASSAHKLAQKDSIIIALGLKAEFYLKKISHSYSNPLYASVNQNINYSKKYVFPNFKIAHQWADDTIYQYIADRLGYFLADFEKSFDYASRVIIKYKPKKIIVGKLMDYPGASVLNGTLKNHAFYLIAKEKGLPVTILNTQKANWALKQIIGSIVKKIRATPKQKIDNQYDLLLIVGARQLCHLGPLINDLGKYRIKTAILTYNLTQDYKNQIDNLGIDYWEKERLIDSEIKQAAGVIHNSLLKNKPWVNFNHPKFKKHKEINNFLKQKIKKISVDEIKEVIIDELLAKKIFSSIKTRVLLTTTDPDTKILPYIKVAKESGIRTVCLQHGAFYPFESPAIYPQSKEFITWSDITKKQLLRCHHFKSLKMMVGQSPFHSIIKSSNNSGNIKRILLLTSVHLVDQALVNENLKELFKAIRKSATGVDLIIRTHPNQSVISKNVDVLFKHFNLKGRLDNSDLLTCISKSDIVLYEDTTAGFDAMLAGKPTIYFNPYTGEDFFGISEYDSSLIIRKKEEITEKVSTFLHDEKLRARYALNGKRYAVKYLGLSKQKGENKNVKLLMKILT